MPPFYRIRAPMRDAPAMDEILHLNAQDTVRVAAESRELLRLEAEWAPADAPPPAHFHPDQDERFVVHEGRLHAVLDGKHRVVEAGGQLDVPRGTVHQMWNDGQEPAHATWETRPALRTGDWFRKLDELNGSGTRQPPVEELIAAVHEYGDVFRLAQGS